MLARILQKQHLEGPYWALWSWPSVYQAHCGSCCIAEPIHWGKLEDSQRPKLQVVALKMCYWRYWQRHNQAAKFWQWTGPTDSCLGCELSWEWVTSAGRPEPAKQHRIGAARLREPDRVSSYQELHWRSAKVQAALRQQPPAFGPSPVANQPTVARLYTFYKSATNSAFDLTKDADYGPALTRLAALLAELGELPAIAATGYTSSLASAAKSRGGDPSLPKLDCDWELSGAGSTHDYAFEDNFTALAALKFERHPVKARAIHERWK